VGHGAKRITKKCTRVADRAFPEVKVTPRQPGDFWSFCRGDDQLKSDDITINRPLATFTERWHRVAFAIFVVCWTTMLLPLLLFPNSAAARLSTLALLGIGAIAVLSLLLSPMIRSRKCCLDENEQSPNRTLPDVSRQ
jgi:hypothetical protein